MPAQAGSGEVHDRWGSSSSRGDASTGTSGHTAGCSAYVPAYQCYPCSTHHSTHQPSTNAHAHTIARAHTVASAFASTHNSQRGTADETLTGSSWSPCAAVHDAWEPGPHPNPDPTPHPHPDRHPHLSPLTNHPHDAWEPPSPPPSAREWVRDDEPAAALYCLTQSCATAGCKALAAVVPSDASGDGSTMRPPIHNLSPKP